MQHAVTGLGAFLTTLIKTVLMDTVILLPSAFTLIQFIYSINVHTHTYVYLWVG